MTDREQQNYHHGHLKEKLLDVSLHVIEKEGLEALSLRNIAKKIGVSHAAPYHHFSGKKELLTSIASKGFDKLTEQVTMIVVNEQNGPLQIKKMALAYITFAYNQPQLYRLMFSLGNKYLLNTNELRKSALTTFDLLKKSLNFSDKQGRLENVAMACWAMTHGLAMLLIDGQIEIRSSEEIDTKMGQTLEIMWTGVMNSLAL